MEKEVGGVGHPAKKMKTASNTITSTGTSVKTGSKPGAATRRQPSKMERKNGLGNSDTVDSAEREGEKILWSS